MGVTMIRMIASAMLSMAVCFMTLLTTSLAVLALMRTIFAMMWSHQKTTLVMENPFQSWPLSYPLSNMSI